MMTAGPIHSVEYSASAAVDFLLGKPPKGTANWGHVGTYSPLADTIAVFPNRHYCASYIDPKATYGRVLLVLG